MLERVRELLESGVEYICISKGKIPLLVADKDKYVISVVHGDSIVAVVDKEGQGRESLLQKLNRTPIRELTDRVG